MSTPNNDTAGLLITSRNLTKSVETLAAQVKQSQQRTLALAVSLVLDVALTAALTFLGFNVRNVSDCQAQQNAAFRVAVDHVREADNDFNQRELASYDAQLTLLDTGLGPSRTTAQKTAATNTYRQALLDAKAAILAKEHTTATNPIPAGNCS